MLGLGRRNFLAIPNTEKLTWEKRHFLMTAQLTWNHEFKGEEGNKTSPCWVVWSSVTSPPTAEQAAHRDTQQGQEHCGDLAQSGYRTLGLHSKQLQRLSSFTAVWLRLPLLAAGYTPIRSSPSVYRLLWGLPGCQKLWEECLQTRKINDI